jgi:hypothetical protein
MVLGEYFSLINEFWPNNSRREATAWATVRTIVGTPSWRIGVNIISDGQEPELPHLQTVVTSSSLSYSKIITFVFLGFRISIGKTEQTRLSTVPAYCIRFRL